MDNIYDDSLVFKCGRPHSILWYILGLICFNIGYLPADIGYLTIKHHWILRVFSTSTWVFEPLSLFKASAVASSTSVGPFFEGWRWLNIHFHPFPRNSGLKTSAVATQKDSLKLDILILTARKLTNRVGSVFRTLPTFQDSGRQQLEYAAQRDLQVGSHGIPSLETPNSRTAPNSPDTRGKYWFDLFISTRG